MFKINNIKISRIILFLISLLIIFSAKPQNLIENKSQLNIETTKNVFVFEVNSEKLDFPENILNGLSDDNYLDLSDKIIFTLIQTGKYQNVSVKEEKDNINNSIKYFIKANYLKKIQDVIFNGINSNEQISYQKSLNLQSGKIFNAFLIDEDIKKINKTVQEKGYPNAFVKNYKLKQFSNNLINLIYNIEKNTPCRIDQIIIENSSSNILNFLNLPIETGTLCDIPAIENKLHQIKNEYWRQGYLNAITKIKNISYSPSKERAKISLIIEKGLKTTVQILDENNVLLSTDFLNSRQTIITYSDLLLSTDDDLKSLIITYYQNLGYPYVSVTNPTRIKDNYGNTTIKFIVNRKKLVSVGDVYYLGNLPVTTEVVNAELGFNSGFFAPFKPFIQKDLLTYRDKLRNIFFRQGYADARVSIPDINISSDGTRANLIFNFTKGDKYILSKINIKNLPLEIKLDNNKLNSILKIGDAINFNNKQSFINEIISQIYIYGYLYTKIDVTQDLKEQEGVKLVTLNLEVDSGPPVYIGKIFAQGDVFNKEKTIISISKLKEGQLFSQIELDKARTRIMRHDDLFSSVTIELTDPSALNKKETILNVVIHPRGRSGYLFTLSPGYGTLRGYRFGTDYTLNKITDNGLRLISSASVSQENQQSSFASSDTKQILGQQINIGLTEPLFRIGPLYTPLDLSAIVGYQMVAKNLTNREYQTLKFASEWKSSFLNTNTNLSTLFIHEKSKSTSSQSAVLQTVDSPSLVNREFLNILSLDNRNNIGWPTSGGLYSFGFGMARFGFGSDVQYNRYLPNGDIYFPIYNKFSGAFFLGGIFVSDTVNRNGETLTPPASIRATLIDKALIRGFPETYGYAAAGPLFWIHYTANSGLSNCNTQLAASGGTNLVFMKSEGRYRLNEFVGFITFLDTGINYFSAKEISQVNNQIQSQINSSVPISGQCSADKASLINPDNPDFKNGNFAEEYWRQAYVSSGVGVRIILGNVASVSLDYGYPIKDPSENQSGCVTPQEALQANTAPKCISRIQNTTINQSGLHIQFRGAFHIGIGAKF